MDWTTPCSKPHMASHRVQAAMKKQQLKAKACKPKSQLHVSHRDSSILKGAESCLPEALTSQRHIIPPGCQLQRIPLVCQPIASDKESPRFIIGDESPSSVSSNCSQSTIIFTDSMISVTSSEESIPSFITSYERPASDRSDNQSTIIFSEGMKFGTNRDASDDESPRSITGTESPAFDSMGDEQSTNIFSESMMFGTNKDTSDNESPRSITSNESPASVSNQSTIIFSDSLVSGTNKDDSCIMSPKETDVTYQKVVNATFIISTESLNDPHVDIMGVRRNTVVFSDARKRVGDTFIAGEAQNETLLYANDMKKDESLLNDTRKMVDDTFIVGGAQNETLLLRADIKNNEAVFNDVRKKVSDTFVVGDARNETLLLSGDMRNDEAVFNDVRKMFGDTFIVADAQNETLPLTTCMRNVEAVYNDTRKMFGETFIVGDDQNETLLLTDGMGNDEAVLNDTVKSETFIVSEARDETLLFTNGNDDLKKGKPVDVEVKDMKLKRGTKESSKQYTKVKSEQYNDVEAEKVHIKRQQVKPRGHLKKNSQKNTEVEAKHDCIEEEEENYMEVEEAKQSSRDAEMKSAIPKERRRRVIHTKSSIDDEMEPCIRVSRGRKCKSRAVAAISAMLNDCFG